MPAVAVRERHADPVRGNLCAVITAPGGGGRAGNKPPAGDTRLSLFSCLDQIIPLAPHAHERNYRRKNGEDFHSLRRPLELFPEAKRRARMLSQTILALAMEIRLLFSGERVRSVSKNEGRTARRECGQLLPQCAWRPWDDAASQPQRRTGAS